MFFMGDEDDNDSIENEDLTLRRQAERFFERNAGYLFGGFIGLFVAVLFLMVGFWEAVLIIACVSLGSYIGGNRDVFIRLRRLFSSFRDFLRKY